MSSGGSWDPQQDIKNMSDNPVESLFNAFSPLIGFKDGKPTAGFAVRAADEALGEVTGRNIARKQAMQAQDALNESKAAAENERKAAVLRQQNQELAASNAAGSANAKLQRTSTSTGTSGIEQQMATDFLGL